MAETMSDPTAPLNELWARLAELNEGCTPGPWKTVLKSWSNAIETEHQIMVDGEPYVVDGKPSSGLLNNEVAPEVRCIADNEFIVALRNAFPQILTALRAQQAQPVAQALTDEQGHIWPAELMLRDTLLHDDLGGAGQRIYTTAGQGYKKVKYVRADLSPRAQTRREVVEEIKLLLRTMAASDKPADRGMVYEESLGMLVYSPAEHLLAQIDAIRALETK